MDFKDEKPIGEQIRLRCNANDISLSKLSRLSGVPRQTLEMWKNSDNKTIKSLRKIEKVFTEIEHI